MFLPEIYMHLQHPAATRGSSPIPRDAANRKAGTDDGGQRPVGALPSLQRRAGLRPQPAPEALNEWDEWKSVRDVA